MQGVKRAQGNRPVAAVRLVSRKRAIGREALWRVLLLLVLFAGTGCSLEARYRLAEVLFDEPPRRSTEPERGKSHSEEPVVQTGASLAGEAESLLKVEGSIHGPYAARLCQACHAGKGQNAAAGGDLARLKHPPRQLCLSCHGASLEVLSRKSRGAARAHGPVASGDCAGCHVAHRSLEEDLLRVAPRGLCTPCHDLQELASRADPNAKLHGPVAAGECMVCHQAHGGEGAGFLRRPAHALCRQCHGLRDLSAKHPELEGRECVQCHDPHRTLPEVQGGGS